MSSLCSDSFASCDSDASHTSTTSSDQVEIHISEAFYDVEPPYVGNDLMTSSPVPSSWQGESPSNTPRAWIPHLMAYSADSTLPASPPSTAGNFFHPSDAPTSITLERDEEKEKWIPTASFIRPFEYNEWEEWDSESGMCTTEGSLGGYGGGDEESRISHYGHPPRSVGTRVSAQLRGASRRGTIASTKGSDQLGTFDFDALPAFRAVVSPAAVPPVQRRARYRTCDASPPPPLHDETGLTEADREGGVFRTWFVEVPKVFIRRTQGKCMAAKEVIKDVLSRSANETSRQNGGQGGDGVVTYRDAPETGDGERKPTVTEGAGLNGPAASTASQSLPQSHNTLPIAKEKGKLDIKQAQGGWRVRWKRALSVPAFKSPLTKVLSPVVTRAQWEVVIRSGILAFAISCVVVAVLVAVPVP